MRSIVAAATVLVAFASACHADDLKVFVKNVRGLEGNIVGCVWPSSSGYPDCFTQAPGLLQVVPAATPNPTLIFPNLAPGTYSVSVIHDADGNGKLDSDEATGLYSEGIGTSNNSRKRTGPPEARKSDFKFRRTTGIDIDVFYYSKR
jgi:uncharacterized protein (DUF2141 family)